MAVINKSCGSYYNDSSTNLPELSDNNEYSSDLYYESEDADDNSDSGESVINIQWTGYGKRIPVILFNTEAIHNDKHFRAVGEQCHLTFKFTTTSCKLIQTILLSHGFLEVKPNSQEYNLTWCNNHPKPSSLKFMTHFQKINHFPRSYELTRKDRLFKNIQRMQQMKGHRHFDFIPASYVLPGDYEEFCSNFMKNRGLYIVKPVASSQGKGVFIISHSDQVPFDEHLIVSKYISSPLVIDGFKFDIRLYVAVTSYDPLIIYLYEEGLTRLATVKYENGTKHITNQCMHLTNFSVNKRNQDYVKNDDPNVEDFGNKWSMSALLRHLRTEGKDTAGLMMKIESVIIKTILSAESSITAACKMFQPFRGNCFELYGFDILIDQALKPWVLEVNFSPSLACGTPLDFKIKSNMLCDLFSLIGVVCQDPSLKNRTKATRGAQEVTNRIITKLTSSSYLHVPSEEQHESIPVSGLSSEEIKILRGVKEEESRKGGWVRIFPNADSWNQYGAFLHYPGTHNLMLHQRLFQEEHTEAPRNKPCKSITARPLWQKSKAHILTDENGKVNEEKCDESYTRALDRARQYERMLEPIRSPEQKQTIKSKFKGEKPVQGLPDVDGSEENEWEKGIMNDQGEDTKLQEKLKGKDTKLLTTFTKMKTKFVNVPDERKEPESRNTAKYEEKETAAVRETHQFELDSVCDKNDTIVSEDKKQLFCAGFDVISFLQSGFTLSEVQARITFTSYLKRVQERLLSDWSTFIHTRGTKAVNAQLAVLTQFLKCAAQNLPPAINIAVPSKKLPLDIMKRILAKQLDFYINFYCHETEQIKYMYKSGELEMNPSGHYGNINEHLFDNFVTVAMEDELEAVLMIYTRNNKSQTVFLGMDSRLKNNTLSQYKKEVLSCCHDNSEFRHRPKATCKFNDMTGVKQVLKLNKFCGAVTSLKLAIAFFEFIKINS